MTLVLSILVIAALALWSWKTRGGGASLGGGAPMGGAISRASRPPKKACKWVADGETRGRLRPFRCTTCGVTAFSQNETGPDLCKKGLSENRLN